MVLVLLSVLFVLAVVHLYLRFRVPKGLPPGPFLPLPILRRLPFSGYFGLTPLEAFDELRKKHGDLFSVHLGHKRVVMMCDYKQVRDVFARNITKRPEEIVNDWRGGRFGVIFSNGDDWKVQRRLFASTIKSSGFGRGAVERSVEAVWPRIMEEAEAAGDEVGYKAFDSALTELLVYSFASPSVFSGGRPRSRALDTFNISRLFGIQWSEFELWYRFPLLRHLAPGWSGYSLAHQVLKQAHKELRAIVGLHENEAERNSKEANVYLGNVNKNNKSVTEFTRIEDARNEDDDDDDGDPQKKRTKDFIDIYLEKLAEFKQEGHSLLTDHGTKCIVGTLDNILVGGDGIHLTFYAFVHVLGTRQDVQDKVRAELVDILGPDRPIHLDQDRNRLPYCVAFLMETIRYCAISGYGAPHQVEGPKPVEIGPYSIPPGVDVFPGLKYIMHDPQYWDSPGEFCPERFIDKDTGRAITNNPYYVPFEIGPRACPGKGFVMDVMLALLARVVRDFKIEYSRRVKEPRKGLLDGVSFLSEGAAAETDGRGGGSVDDLELVGMALVQPRPYTVRMRRITGNKKSSVHSYSERNGEAACGA